MGKLLLRIAGVDWATEGAGRALVALEIAFDAGRAERIRLIPTGKSPVALELDGGDFQRVLSADPKTKLGGSARIRDTESFDLVVLDVPLGFPLFAKTVLGRQKLVSELEPALAGTIADASAKGAPLEELFARRYTDEVVRYEAGKPTLNVSTERLALGALAFELTPGSRARSRIETLGRLRDADVTIIEVNPAATLEVLSCVYTELWVHRSIASGHGGWLRLRELEPSLRPPRLGPWVKFARGSETQVRKPSRLFYKKKGEDEFVRYALAEWLIGWLKIQDASAHLEALSASSEGFDAFVAAVTGVLYAARALSQKLDVQHPPAGVISIRTPDAAKEAEFRRADGSSRDVFGYDRTSFLPATRSGGTWLCTEADLAQREGWIFFPSVGVP